MNLIKASSLPFFPRSYFKYVSKLIKLSRAPSLRFAPLRRYVGKYICSWCFLFINQFYSYRFTSSAIISVTGTSAV